MSSTESQNQSASIAHFLQNEMGMSDFVAARFAGQWKRQHTPETAMLSTMLVAAIHHQIDIYRKQSFAKFGLEISIYPAEGANSIEPSLPFFPEKVMVGYSRYVFAPFHNEEPSKTLRVRLRHGGVQVYFCRTWQSISAYLDEVGTERSEEFDATLALQRQCKWWEVTGKTFDMMAMPGELRNAIFDNILPSPVVRPFSIHACRRRGAFATAPKNSTALMRTSKQLYKEASYRLYHTTTFQLDYHQLVSKTLKNKFLQPRLRSLSLTLSHSAFLKLFHFSSRCVEFPHAYVNRHLRDLQLDTLEIYIGPPSRIAEKSYLEDACQIAVVDLIFSVAWPSIKGHPVTISGYVKDSQKERIKSLINDEREAYEKWAALNLVVSGKVITLRQYGVFVARMESEEQGGVRLDGKAWEEIEGKGELGHVSILKTHSLIGFLECKCATKCCAGDWTCED